MSSATPFHLAVGTVFLGRYEVLRGLGEGGSAATYLVRDRRWLADAALKLLRRTEPELFEILREEFARLRELFHPHLCQVREFDVYAEGEGERPRAFYAADYVPGETLAQRAGASRWDAVRAAVGDALEALDLLHRAGVLHGDFKPENVIVGDQGAGTLIDLGCAQSLGARPSGFVRGSPGYLAPEVLAGKDRDARADLYAVGVTLQRLGALLAEPLPDALAALAASLVEPDPAKRPASVREVLEAEWPERCRTGLVPARLGRIVGRRVELEAVGAALDALVERTAACSRVVHVVGVQGSGKSRLLRELQWRARAEARVLAANADANLGIRVMLEEAGLAELPRVDLDAVLALRERLVQEQRPCVLLVDDAHRLADSQRLMLEALVRSIEPTDPVLVVATSLPAFVLGGPRVARLDLAPLSVSDVREIVADDWAPWVCDALHRQSGGNPGELRALLLGLAAGVLNESELARDQEGEVRQGAVSRLLPPFAETTRRALAVLAVVGRRLSSEALAALGVRPHDLEAALRAGLVVHDAAGYGLGNPRDGERILSEYGVEDTRVLDLTVADWISAGLGAGRTMLGAGDDAALMVLHLARGGELSRAVSLLGEHADDHATSPQAWLVAAQTIARLLPASADASSPDVELFTARLEQITGHAESARGRLTNLLARCRTPNERFTVRLELGACWLRLGATADAVSELRLARGEAQAVDEEARVADLLAQALCRQGAYEEAVQVVDEVLALGGDAKLRASLDEAAGVALSSLGRYEMARQRLDAAAQVADRCLPPRNQVRTSGVRALVAFQMGKLDEARRHFAEALSVAEHHGLSDQLANAAINLGSVLHQGGMWADALAHYERGQRLAGALGQGTTEAYARLNLAKLYLDIGAEARAERQLDSCEALAARLRLSSVNAAILALRAEVALAQEGPDAASALLVQARDLAQGAGEVRDRTEIEIRIAEIMLQSGDVGRAAAQVEQCVTLAASLDAADVRVRAGLLTARLLRAQRRLREAVSQTEEVRSRAHELELTDLEAESVLLLSELWSGMGSELLASKYGLTARELWERGAATLPPELRDGFWRGRRRGAMAATTTHTEAPAVAAREAKLRLLVEIFRRLNSSLKTEEVLECAMDAAIELTGAERGFLLRTSAGAAGGALKVAVARNVDREQLEHPQFKFSRAIAEQVISTRQAVATASAQTDERFQHNESVHALRLQSVVCVPVCSPAGCLGALYLDNRFKSQAFSEQDVDLVLAFADQVAIALSNATLHQELQRQNRELVAQSKQIQELLRNKEAEVLRLTEQAERQRPKSGHRYDYGAIVGSSPAIERVFEVLDRVIETDLTVLITGESGTGKELVARAIHQNCASRSGPLVSINCAAVPEALLEAELFGYARGAFTGANTSRDGLFVEARGGTVFLDELGEMPPAMQVKLLRVLQEREVRPLGHSRSVPIDVRLVCATNRNLMQEVATGQFREDLFYRVSAVELRLPSLRERPEDLPLLVDHFLRRAAERMHRPVPVLTHAALARLVRFAWPGNVRQLQNVLTRALVMARGDRIVASDIDLELPTSTVVPTGLQHHGVEAEREAERLAEALTAHQWNIAEVARLLKVSRPTLYRRMKQYGLVRKK